MLTFIDKIPYVMWVKGSIFIDLSQPVTLTNDTHTIENMPCVRVEQYNEKSGYCGGYVPLDYLYTVKVKV